MKCPKCDHTLIATTISKTSVDRCGACGGLWFDVRELATVLSRDFAELQRSLPATDTPASFRDSPPSVAGDHDARGGTCPRCAASLERLESIEVPGLHYDRCGTCHGAWLDGGELQRITAEPTTAAEAAFFAKGD